jgi:hypothetical protein
MKVVALLIIGKSDVCILMASSTWHARNMEGSTCNSNAFGVASLATGS